MKMEFLHTGDVHALMMDIMQGRSFALFNEGKNRLEVQPNIKEGGFQLRSGSCNSQMIMAVPVTLKDFKASAMMSFEYNIEPSEVAAAVPAVDAVDARPAQGELPEQAARPAIEARPKILVKLFQRGIGAYHGVVVKFE